MLFILRCFRFYIVSKRLFLLNVVLLNGKCNVVSLQAATPSSYDRWIWRNRTKTQLSYWKKTRIWSIQFFKIDMLFIFSQRQRRLIWKHISIFLHKDDYYERDLYVQLFDKWDTLFIFSTLTYPSIAFKLTQVCKRM